MEKIVYEDEKLVEFWLTNLEETDATLQQYLQDEAMEWKEKKYKIVIFHSGKEDLTANTKALLSYNLKELIKEENKEMKKGA